MLKTVTAVLVDLYRFATNKENPPHSASMQQNEDVQDRHTTTEAFTTLLVDTLKQQPHSLSTYTSFSGPTETLEDGGVVYIAEDTVSLCQQPAAAFDMVIATLRYGQKVNSGIRSGRWLQITVGQQVGWVLRDSIVSDIARVRPVLCVGKCYDAAEDDTRAIRNCIADEFNVNELQLPLQDAELVTYKLRCREQQLPWSQQRPRTPGRWHQLLRGTQGVRISVFPITGSVMEFYRAGAEGQLAYVESVSPAEVLTIATIDRDGVYTESELTKDEWTALQPVFIEVT